MLQRAFCPRGWIALLLLLTASPVASAQQSYPWSDALTWQLERLNEKYGGVPQNIIVVHLGITDRARRAGEIADILSARFGLPVVALPSYSGSPGFDKPRAMVQYFVGGTFPVHFDKAWDRIISEGHLINGVVFHSGAGIPANHSRLVLADFISRNPGKFTGNVVFAMTDLKEQTSEAFGRVGVKAVRIGTDDRVSSLTKPVCDYIPFDAYLGVNSTLLGSSLKLLRVGVTDLARHSLLQRQQELVDALELSSVPVPETKSDMGGVDFSSVELRYLSEFDESSKWVLQTAFEVNPADAEASVDLTEAGELSWNAFFIWLSLPGSKFWVNLNPSEPDRIIDAELAKTDVGRIMLEADLQLKRDVAQLLHPETSSIGRKFWDSLFSYVERSVDIGTSKGFAIPTSFRVWVVPAPANVWVTEESIYVVEARLDAKLENDYSQDLSAETAKLGKLVPENVSEIQAYAETLLRRDILPQLVENINNSSRYSELRQVYHSFVVAEWYKTGHSSDSPAFEQLIDSRSTRLWPARVAWSKADVFEKFVKSLRDGEFNITKEETDTVGFTIHTQTRQYLYGGVDFTHIELESVAASELLSQEPDLLELLFDALYTGGGYRVSADSSKQQWLGGTFVAPMD